MNGNVFHIENLIGLKENDIKSLQQRFGKNIFQLEKPRRFFHVLFDIFREPMFILLIIACIIYFVLGKSSEGWMMMAAMFFVAAISFYQEVKSTNALEALKEYTEPKIVVIRDGHESTINAADLVPGDIILLEEGSKIPADARIIQSNDLTVNESIITGESLPVDKKELEGYDLLYQGTTVNSGKCYASVIATGNNTLLGKLGKSVSGYAAPKTLLQVQIGKFVKRLAFFGISAFLIIWLVNYLRNGDIILSLLFGLTLAMASIPEEIPVAFSSFMALGAYHMSKLGIISRQPQTIENLGAVSVICLDKTGTITENKMQVKNIYDAATGAMITVEENMERENLSVLKYAVLASEVNPFDAMEKAIWEAYRHITFPSYQQPLKLIYEYALQGQPPMMTHVYEHNNKKIIAAKGGAERIIKICRLDEEEIKRIESIIKAMATKGFRVIGVASASHTAGDLPDVQDNFYWKFEGLLGLYDPPKKNITEVFKKFYGAKIHIKLITGDYPETVMTIAEQVGMEEYKHYLTGNDVMYMEQADLQEAVKTVNIFARMFPEAKLRVIDALKANGEIVAMTGDGVNDAPALKSSHIGIAMGKKGTEIAKQAADLILTDDNLDKVAGAVQQGRKIFSNLKKAIRYIISIHIPIISIAALPLLLGWKYPNIFTPVHIIFLELIMGPTCSIFFEREPVETDIMQLKPRDRSKGFFFGNELLVSIVQGIVIAAGILVLYYFYMSYNFTLEETRTVVFTALVISNIFLTFTNRSFTENFTKTIFYKNTLALPVVVISILFISVIHFIPAVTQLFGMTVINIYDFLICLATAFAIVMWFEVYKTNLKTAGL
ncbi:MAG: cation-translocating P-type ATPase [Sphingobacteriales bacterium]|nr:cation-translocating P-type ATPase [Sphingobacteriales bacterium]